ncbi:hypothetical protein [Roseibium sediminis]|uniref:Bbp19 family protein n=1 Tax=Roseibium sediminis TaxID=1775174 RepID=UPI00123D7E68|nr:hypothetical protein [Roseibium sediminis]
MWQGVKRLIRGRHNQARELERSYRAVFLCPEGQAVLADLAAESGMYLAAPYELNERQSGYVDGRKALFARILSMLTVTPEEHLALQEAARRETLQLKEDEDQ